MALARRVSFAAVLSLVVTMAPAGLGAGRAAAAVNPNDPIVEAPGQTLLSGLSQPAGVAIDGAGDAFVIDNGQNRIVELSHGGTQSTVPLTGLAVTHAVGVAAGAGGDLFVGDAGNNRVVKYSKGVQTTLPFTGLGAPAGVAVDGAGDVFVEDPNNNQVLKLTPGGTQTTVGVTGWGDNGGLAVDAAGDVFVADFNNNRVIEVPAKGAQITLGSSLKHPTAVAVDSSGDVFEIGDGYDINCSPLMAATELLGDGSERSLGCTSLKSAAGVALDGHNNLVVADGGNSRVVAIPISQARFVNPANYQSNVDTTKPFTWSSVANAQAYYLAVGTTFGGFDLVNSGTLAASQLAFPMPALPAGKQLFAHLFTMTNGVWTSWEIITFMALPANATFTEPTAGQQNVDTTKAFAWSTTPGAQGYYLVVGTTHFGADLVNSGVLPATQSSLPVPALPTGRTLYATLLTETNGAWTRYQEVTFTAAPGEATFIYPTDGQTGVDTTKAFTWSTIPAAQGYYLVVGTTPFGTDLVKSGVLPTTQSAFTVPALPSGSTLYATLLTETNGAWTRSQAITFTTGLNATG